MDEKRAVWKTLLIWAGVALALFILVHALFVGGTNRRVQAELERIRASGEPVTSADLAGPKVPDEFNAALIYDQAFQMANSPPTDKDIKALEEFSATDYSAKKPDEWAKAYKAWGAAGGVIDLVQEAVSRPECQWPVNWADGFNALFPHFARMRQMARLTSAGAVLEARRGNSDGAVDMIDLGFRVSESMREEPTMIAILVRIATIKIELGGLRNVSAHCRIDAAQAKRLYDRLAKIDLRHGYKKAMLGERAMGVFNFDYVKGHGSRETMSNLLGSGGFGPVSFVGAYPLRPILNADEGVYLRWMRQQIDTAGMTCLEVKRKRIKMLSEADLPAYALFSRIIAPFNRAVLARDSAMAEVAMGQAFLALLAYKDRYGSYPVSLSEVRTRLGWRIPVDPFSGKDLKYTRQGAGFVLYSIGGDMKDDGGQVQSNQGGGYTPGEPGDDVWEVVR